MALSFVTKNHARWGFLASEAWKYIDKNVSGTLMKA